MRKNESSLDFHRMSETKKCRLYNKYDNTLSFSSRLGDVKCRSEEFRLKCWIHSTEGNFFMANVVYLEVHVFLLFLWKSIVNCVACSPWIRIKELDYGRG